MAGGFVLSVTSLLRPCGEFGHYRVRQVSFESEREEE